MNPLFQSHALNSEGKFKSKTIADAFDELLGVIERELPPTNDARLDPSARLLALVRTDLERACMTARKAVAVRPSNQEGSV